MVGWHRDAPTDRYLYFGLSGVPGVVTRRALVIGSQLYHMHPLLAFSFNLVATHPTTLLNCHPSSLVAHIGRNRVYAGNRCRW